MTPWRTSDDLADDVQRAVLEPLVAEARLARCAPPLAAVFLDPLTRERIEYAAAECDAHGAPLLGIDDEYGAWVGTRRALLVLDGDTRYFALYGYLGAEGWHGYVAASSEDAVEAYAQRLGVRGVDVEALSFSELEE